MAEAATSLQTADSLWSAPVFTGSRTTCSSTRAGVVHGEVGR